MHTVQVIRLIDRGEAIQALAGIRQEWQEAGGGNLLQIQASAGLMIYDVSRALNLTQDEQAAILGDDLLNQITAQGFTQ